MSSTSRAGRPSKEKMTKSQTAHNAKSDGPPVQSTKQQPTVEQMRFANILSEHDDPQLASKINQVMELTGKSYDDATVALYDCDNDTNKAVNFLLEQSDQGEWQETTKKKKRGANQKANDTQAGDGKGENYVDPDKREKSRDRERTEENETNDRRERDNYGGRGNRPERPPRLSRGGGQRNNWKGRENDENENNRSESKGRDRGSGRGRGRGQMNGPGRGRGRGGGRGGFGSRNRGGFGDKGPQIDTWTNETAENAGKDVFASNWADGIGTEDWTSDEWTGNLEETKVFTSSAPQEPTSSFSTEQQNFTAEPFPSDAQAFSSETASFATNPQVFGSVVSESQVFTNSLASDSQSFGSSSVINSSSSFGQRLDLGVLLPPKLSNDNTASSVSQQSQFMSQYAKEGTESIKNALGIGTTASQASATSPSLNQPLGHTHSPTVTSQPLSQQQSLQQRPKPQRSKLPPPSKIPASAVEMPGHSSFGSLDVQFGNWDAAADSTFSSEGFSFGGENDTTAVVDNFPNTTVSTTASTLSSHLPLTSSAAETSLSTSSIISSSKNNMTGLESMTSVTSTARSTVYQNSNAATTPAKDYRESSLQQTKLSSPPEPIPFPASQPDRKTSPHYTTQRSNQPGPLSSGKTGSASQQLPFNQSGYSSSYQNNNTSYQQHKPNLSNSYQHSASSSNSANSNLSSHNLPTTLAAALHSSQYSSHQNYQSQSSYQTQSGFPTNQSSHTQNSLYHGPNQTGSYSSQTGSSYQTGSSTYTSQPGPSSYQTPSASAYQSHPGSTYQSGSSGSAGYSNQSGSGSSYQNQTSSVSSYQGASTGAYQNQASYHSRDSQTGTAFQSGSNQSGPSAYQSSASQSSSNYQHQPTVTQSSGSTYQRDSQTGQSGFSSQSSYGSSHQTSPMSNNKLSDNLAKMTVKDTSLESRQTNTQHSYDHTSSTSSASLSTTTTTTSSSLASGAVSTSLDMTQSTAAATTSTTSTVKSTLLQSVTGKVQPTNPPPGVPPLLPNYIVGQPGMPYFHSLAAAQQPMYSYEELQLLQQRLPMPGYYDMPFQPPTTLSTRDQSALAGGVPYSGADGKLSRMDAQSPVQAQTSQQQTQAAAHQQTFINPTIPPGYGYYYPTQGMPLSGFSYTPTMFPIPPSVTNAAHAGSTANAQFQKPSYASHYAASAYDELSQAQDFKSAYGSGSQAQNKASSGSSVGSSSATDITGTAYGKHTQSYDKQSFHAGTPPPFNLPLPTSNQAGPMGGHTAAYAAYMHPGMIHQQQMLHHPLQQDSTGGSSRGSQQSTQPKGNSNKAYNPAYWATN